MASQTLRHLYREARAANVGWIVGESALSAWWSARTLRQWAALEDLGLVRLIAIAEPDYDWEVGCDCGRKDCHSEAFGVVGQFRLPNEDGTPFGTIEDEHGWIHGDSVWGNVGYRNVLDWRENPYVLSIMSDTIDAFRTAWKDHAHHRCATCHGTGRTS